MGELSLSREGYTSYLGVPQELKVRLGDDVVVKCSASSSEEPSYYWNKDVRKPLGLCIVAVSSLCFWKLVILSPAPSLHFRCDHFISLLSCSSLSRSLFLSGLCSKHSFNFLSFSNTVKSFSSHLFPLGCHISIPSSEEVLCI